MALPANALPFGLRDVKLTPIDAAGAYGSIVDLPASRTFSFSESEDFEELRGDDIVQAEHGNGPLIDWDLEQGGISLAALKVMAGGTLTQSGVTPNLKNLWAKGGLDARPYFYVEGQAINDNAGDTHVILYRCKATGDIGGEFSEGSFAMLGTSGRAYPDTLHSNKLWDIVHNETAAASVVPT